MTRIAGDGARLRIGYVPRLHLAAYLAFLLAALVLSAREALAGRGDIALILLALGAGTGIGAIVLFVEATEIVLDRAAGTVAWRNRRALGRSSQRIALADVVSAISEGPFGKDKGSSQRPALVLRGGATLALRGAYIPRRASRRIAAAINLWLGGA